MLRSKIFNTNYIGALASFLCLIHCIATPFIILAKICTLNDCIEIAPWWKAVDFVFLFISLLAIFYALKMSNQKWMKISLLLTWSLLFFVIINETIELVPLIEEMIYLPTVSLICLHLYNHKKCNCVKDDCCVKKS